MSRRLFLLLLVGLSIESVKADEFRPLFRGVRAQAMGNAFTAVADDEQAIFYNPAGLAGVKSFSFKMLSLSADVSSDLMTNTKDLQTAMGNPGISSVNALIGKNLYGRVQGMSSLLMPRFGFAAIYDAQVALRLKNLAMPTGMYGAQNTYGFQGGFGIPIYKFKKKRGELRLGFAGKVLWRAGGFVHPSTTQIMTIDATALQGNMTQFGKGMGLDAGLQFVRAIKKKYTLQAGLAMTDIGNTTFESGGEPQLSKLTAGLAASLKTADLKATLAFDYSHVMEAIDWKKKTHMGVELKFPILTLYTGLNQFYFTYGAGIDIGLVKVMYTSYVEELGTLAGQDGERRSMVYLSIKLDP